MSSTSTLLEIAVKNIRRVMYEQHLSQLSLAQKAKLQRSGISMLLNGHDFRITTLEKHARALGVEPYALLMTEYPTKHDHKPSVLDAITALLAAAKEPGSRSRCSGTGWCSAPGPSTRRSS